MRIENGDTPERLTIVRELFREYEKSLGIDLCFQGFEMEMATLPGEYARPRGRLLLTFESEEAVGCGAFRRLAEDVCEMKRLYVKPKHQRKAMGIAIVRELIGQAKEAGYRRMRLDTMPSMARAIALYRSLGFQEIAAYRANPVPGALFFELELATANFSRRL